MTVSRRGRRGSIRIRPESRNRRVKRNAGLKALTRDDDGRPIHNRKSREQWVIACVTRAVGTRGGPGFVQADDVASDIILMLLNAGGFLWEEEEIERFCRKKAAFMVLKHMARREKSECEFTVDGEDGELPPLLDILAVERAMQETIFEAHAAASLLPLLPLLPNKHRQALEILCDGGNPIDVAEEMGLRPWDAIVLIKQAREYIDRVGPIDEAA